MDLTQRLLLGIILAVVVLFAPIPSTLPFLVRRWTASIALVSAGVLGLAVPELLARDAWLPAAAVFMVTTLILRLGLSDLPPACPLPVRMHIDGAHQHWFVALALGITLGAAVTFHLVLSPYIDFSLPLLLVAFGLCVYGEDRMRGRRPGELLAGWRIWLRAHSIELSLLLLITGAADTLRVWIATRYTLLHGTQNDELAVGRDAWLLVHGHDLWPLYVVMHGAAAFFQPLALVFALFGTSMLNLRLTSVLGNALLVPSFYLLARQFVAAPAALCAGSLLGLAYWPATLGTMAFGMMYGATFQCLGLALLLIGVRGGRPAVSALGGAVLALCFYSYLGARIMPLAALPLLASVLFSRTSSARARVLPVLWFCAGFAAVFLPWLSSVLRDRDLLLGDAPGLGQRFADTLHSQPLVALRQAADFAGALLNTLVATPRANTYFPLPSGGLLDPVTATLFVLSMAMVCGRFWRPAYLLVLFGFLPPLLAGSIVQAETLNMYRLGSLVPVVFLAIALLLDRCSMTLQEVPRARHAVVAGLVILACVSGALNLQRAAAYVGDTAYLCLRTDFFNSMRSEDVLIAEAVNRYGPRQAVFVVTHDRGYAEPVDGPWLVHTEVPLVYTPLPGSDHPERWHLRSSSPPLQLGRQYAVFWPPRLGRGQTGITYVIFSDDAVPLLPLLRKLYPEGQERTVAPEGCATNYSLILYTLSPTALLHRR